MITLQNNGRNTIKLTEEILFVVKPQRIDRSLSQEKRGDTRQEEIRQNILAAFDEVDEEPQKYGRPFESLWPVKTWDRKTISELIIIANQMGDHMGFMVQQTLEWAQRINNGEDWKKICNKADTAQWFRLVDCENGYFGRVGGSKETHDFSPATFVEYLAEKYLPGSGLDPYFENIIPMVVKYI